MSSIQEELTEEQLKEQLTSKQEYKYGFVSEVEEESFPPGLSEDVIARLSKVKGEPEWMLQFRLDALKTYYSKPMPKWGGDLETLDRTLDEIQERLSFESLSNDMMGSLRNPAASSRKAACVAFRASNERVLARSSVALCSRAEASAASIGPNCRWRSWPRR